MHTEAVVCACILLAATVGIASSAPQFTSSGTATEVIRYEWELPESSWRYALGPELVPTLEALSLAGEPVPTPQIFQAAPAVTVTPRASATPVFTITVTPSPEPTATPEPPTATSIPPTSTPLPRPRVAPPPQGEIVEQFAAGFRAAGGTEEQLAHAVRIVSCESGWNVYAYNPAGPFYGLGQFLMATWQNVGGGDINSAWQQGYNFAVLYNRSGPAQWPVCQRA